MRALSSDIPEHIAQRIRMPSVVIPHPSRHPNLHVSTHPLVQRDLSILRDVATPHHEFRRVLHRLASLLAVEACADLELSPIAVSTPLEEATGCILARRAVLIPVLRAGLGMLDAFLEVLPDAAVGHVGLYRDEATLEPVEYYGRYPEELESSLVMVLDPMLATGGSADAAIAVLKSRGACDIRLVCIVAAPEGVERMQASHPDVRVIAGALDRGLNEHGYIVPGLGDAGDRQFGTM